MIRTNDITEQYDLAPPADTEAEACAIGSAILDADMRATLLGLLTPDDFHDAAHGEVWRVVGRMHEAGTKFDPVTIASEMRASGVGDAIPTLATVLNVVPSAAHGEHYAQIVRQTAVLRGVIRLANEQLRLAYQPASRSDAPAVAMAAAEKLMALARHGARQESVSIEDAVHEVLSRQDAKKARWVPTGIAPLDDVIGGLGVGLFTIVGGEPGMGKSQLIKQAVRNIAGRGIPCGIITIEENRQKIAENFLAAASGVDNHLIAHDRLNDWQWKRISESAGKVARLPVRIEDAAFDLSAIQAAAQKLVAKHKCEVIAVDHIHLIDAGGNEKSREREVSRISASLKRMFRQLNVAGVAAAQLNRSSNRTERPTLRSLRDSGSLAQDGDTILLLYREDYALMDEIAANRRQPTHTLEVIVAKNKSGPPATQCLHFDGARQTITEMEDRFQ